MHTWTAKTWIQYSASHVATTAPLPSQNCLRSTSEHLISKHFLREHAPRPLVLHAYAQIRHLCNHSPVPRTSLAPVFDRLQYLGKAWELTRLCNPPSKILATGLCMCYVFVFIQDIYKLPIYWSNFLHVFNNSTDGLAAVARSQRKPILQHTLACT